MKQPKPDDMPICPHCGKNVPFELQWFLAGLEHAAEICRIYRDTWDDSTAKDKDTHCIAAHRLKMAINQSAAKLLRNHAAHPAVKGGNG